MPKLPRIAACLVILTLVVLMGAPAAFAAENSTPAKPQAQLPAFLSGGEGAKPLFGGQCQGNCTQYCDSGAQFYYYDSPAQCCLLAQTVCPDHSNANRSVWVPETCGFASIC